MIKNFLTLNKLQLISIYVNMKRRYRVVDCSRSGVLQTSWMREVKELKAEFKGKNNEERNNYYIVLYFTVPIIKGDSIFVSFRF